MLQTINSTFNYLTKLFTNQQHNASVSKTDHVINRIFAEHNTRSNHTSPALASDKIILNPPNVHYHPSDLSFSNSKSTEVQLLQELIRANQQLHLQNHPQDLAPSQSFKTLSRTPTHYSIHNQVERLPLRKAGIAHAQGARPTMEDFHVASSGTIQINQKSVNYELFGIIDGHGGSQCGSFVAAHIQKEIENAILKHGLSDRGIRRALKEAFVQLDAKIANAHLHSGAVAVISLKIGDSLWTANLGDCRAVLKVGDKVIQLSEDAKPDVPRFRKGIEKRGGWVTFRPHDVPRVNGILAIPRSFGDKMEELIGKNGHYVLSPRPKITNIHLSSYPGQSIYLCQGCDGIWDVTTSIEAASILGSSSSVQDDAAAIVRAALNRHSTDNCSALVTKLQ